MVQRNAWFDNGYEFMSTIQGSRRFQRLRLFFHISRLLIALRHICRVFEGLGFRVRLTHLVLGLRCSSPGSHFRVCDGDIASHLQRHTREHFCPNVLESTELSAVPAEVDAKTSVPRFGPIHRDAHEPCHANRFGPVSGSLVASPPISLAPLCSLLPVWPSPRRPWPPPRSLQHRRSTGEKGFRG